MAFADEEEAGQISSQDARGRVLVSRERREWLLEEYDRSGMSGVRFAQFVGIKYTTLAYWLRSQRRQRQREKPLVKAGAEAEAGKSQGTWIEAVVENGSHSGLPAGGLRIYFAGGAYCQIGSAAEATLAAELLGRLGAKQRSASAAA
jgi:hypothetical protein